MKRLKGLPVSPGIAIGPLQVWRQPEAASWQREGAGLEAEWARLQDALERALQDLERVYERARGLAGEQAAEIFRAQQMMLRDPELLGRARALLQERGLSAEAAFQQACDEAARALEATGDPRFQARAADVRDVRDRVLRLLAVQEQAPLSLDSPAIIVARDLAPSDTVALDHEKVLGFATVLGGPTSHAAILARALGLPAVTGLPEEVLELPAGTPAVLDGESGLLVAEPDAETRRAYGARRGLEKRLRERAQARASAPAVTRDGHRVAVLANVGGVEEARVALEAGAEGIGLLRTEFLFLGREEPPGEEEQFEIYREIFQVMGERPVILRTLDVGGDKPLPFLPTGEEANPFLGLRGIRLALAAPDLFRVQVRAALRAAAGRDVRLMFPFVATLGEWREARALVDQCLEELRREGRPVPDRVRLGLMVEIPSVVLLADHFAAEVDFFSIGTNDLAQYLFAADRTNEKVARLTAGVHPALLRMVDQVVRAALVQGKSVGVCGELAGDLVAAPLLVGLGVHELSMSPPRIPLVKELLRAQEMEALFETAQQALRLGESEEVAQLVQSRLRRVEA